MDSVPLQSQAVAVINGREIPLPWSSSNDGQAVVQRVTIDPAILADQTTVEFRCVPGAPAARFHRLGRVDRCYGVVRSQ